ncbi:MAG: hypothetical protein U1A78_17070 [Polyangia bacterium]
MSAELEAQLRAHPQDEQLWLRYAAWLREQKDPRGELIAGALRAPKAADDAAPGRDQESMEPLEAWAEGAPRGAKLEWRHGFIVGLRLQWDESTAAALAAFLGGRSARLVGSLRFDPPAADEDYESEDFDDDPSVGDEVEVRGQSDEERQARVVAMQALAGLDLRALRSLSLAYWRLGTEAARALAGSPHLRALAELDLRYCALGNAGLAALAAALDGGRLEVLHLTRNELTDQGVRALAAIKLPSLRALDLRYNRLGGAGARVLAGAPLVAGLHALGLNLADVGKEGARALAAADALPVSVRRLWSAR